jgi:hypothetical protein
MSVVEAGSAKNAVGWETAGVVLVADDLGAWLIGLLADAVSRRLITAVVGSQQERALQQAATAAVQSVADALEPDAGRAGQLAMVVSEVSACHCRACR